jgi:hypothetical protein
MKTKMMLLFVVLSFSLLVPVSVPKVAAGDTDVNYGPLEQYLPTTCEMYDWVNELWLLGKFGFYGYRMPGTIVDRVGAYYVKDKFKDFGLQNTFLEPVPATFNFPGNWSLKVNVNGKKKEISSYFLRYAAFTPKQGITAPMVYVGQGSDADFAATDVRGKIVVVDIIAPPTPTSAFNRPPLALYSYDPHNTLPGDNALENWPPINFNTYDIARDRGAAGYIAILTFTVDDNNQFLHYYFDGSIPGLSVSPTDGDYLKGLLASGTVKATMTLTGYEGAGTIYNVYGTVPGKNYGTPADEFIVVETHYDGWACNEASGTSVALALAKYFAQFPKETRNHSILFCAAGSHFGKKAEWTTYQNYAYGLIQQNKVKYAAVVEMISKQFKIINGQYVATGLASPRGLMVTTAPFYPPTPPSVIQAAKEAIPKYDLDRTLILQYYFNGEALIWSKYVPTLGHISENAPQFTSADTPNTVMKDDLRKTAAVYIDIIQAADKAYPVQ